MRKSSSTFRAFLTASCLLGSSESLLGPGAPDHIFAPRSHGSGIRSGQGLTVTSAHATVVAPFTVQPSVPETTFRAADPSADNHERERETTSEEDETLQELMRLLGASPTDLLRFQYTSDGVRGVYLKSSVRRDDILLKIPLESCLQDASPPSWLSSSRDEEGDEPSAYNCSGEWATRLAASLLHLQLSPCSEGKSMWLSLLPDPDYLRASLPVHWPEETVENARSTSLELAVDSAYFGRAEAVEELVCALKLSSGLVDGRGDDEIRRLCNDALDVVQTRTCRLTMTTNNDSEPNEEPLRVLAPVFDFINHGSIKVRGDYGANSQFQLEDDCLVVRAVKDLDAGEEVLIDYGESARPAWRCLLSYGFIPQYNRIPGPHEDAPTESEDEDNEAEVYMDGTRYIVGPSQVPFDMVAAAYESDHPLADDDDEPVVSLTSEVAIKLANRISEVAYYLLLEKERDMFDDDSSVTTATTFDVISSKEAAALRWSQHRVLMACALGLREFAAENQ